MAHHPPSVIVVGEGLVLRLADVTDADEMARVIGLSLEHLTPWMGWAKPEAADPEQQRARLQAVRREHGDDLYLIVADGAMVGACGVHRRIGPGAVEIGYWLAPFATGLGYATRAARALTAAALELPDVDHVEIHCDQANTRSAAIAERLSFRLDRVEPDEVAAPNELGLSMVWVYEGG